MLSALRNWCLGLCAWKDCSHNTPMQCLSGLCHTKFWCSDCFFLGGLFFVSMTPHFYFLDRKSVVESIIPPRGIPTKNIFSRLRRFWVPSVLTDPRRNDLLRRVYLNLLHPMHRHLTQGKSQVPYLPGNVRTKQGHEASTENSLPNQVQMQVAAVWWVIPVWAEV